MFTRLRALDPGQPLPRVLFYRACAWVVLAAFVLIYRIRIVGANRIPRTGGLLVIANHQSHLDPPLIGVGLLPRHAAMIARAGLFRTPLIGAILKRLGTIAIREDEGDAGALRAAIAQLKAGRVVVIFPEGSRSFDGRLQPFKRGTWLLLARSGADVLPAAVEGCFHAFPRQRRFPVLFARRVAVQFGDPVRFDELKPLGADAGLAELARRIEALRRGLEPLVPTPRFRRADEPPQSPAAP